MFNSRYNILTSVRVPFAHIHTTGERRRRRRCILFAEEEGEEEEYNYAKMVWEKTEVGSNRPRAYDVVLQV